MRRFGLTPLLVLAAIATALLVGARFTPFFPGDRELTRVIQTSIPQGDWARAVTRAAYTPWIYGVLGVSALAALRVAGWRGVAAMLVTFFASMHGERLIKNAIARPRPSAQQMQIAAAQSGYSMPSGWALLFGSTVGLLMVLAWRNTRGVARTAYVAGCVFVLIAGLIARVSLGAHWPSDVIAGYLLPVVVGLGLVELLASVSTSRGPSRKSAARR